MSNNKNRKTNVKEFKKKNRKKKGLDIIERLSNIELVAENLDEKKDEILKELNNIKTKKNKDLYPNNQKFLNINQEKIDLNFDSNVPNTPSPNNKNN